MECLLALAIVGGVGSLLLSVAARSDAQADDAQMAALADGEGQRALAEALRDPCAETATWFTTPLPRLELEGQRQMSGARRTVIVTTRYSTVGLGRHRTVAHRLSGGSRCD